MKSINHLNPMKHLKPGSAAHAEGGLIQSRGCDWRRLLWSFILGLAGMTAALAAQTVEVYNVSLRFKVSTATKADAVWQLDLTSGPATSPANGELALADGTNRFTHAGIILVSVPAVANWDAYHWSLNIPTGDADRNGIFDVWEEQAVVNARTEGEYLDGSQVAHPVQATWNKASGASSGLCVLEFPDLGLSFECVFENIHYSGAYDYSRSGGSLWGRFTASQHGATSATTLAGPLNLKIGSPDLLTWGEGQWQTETNAPFLFEGFNLDRTAPMEYSGFFIADDGDLSSARPDYQTWLLVLPNIPDANTNSIPDLIEGPETTTRPSLSISRVGDKLMLQVANAGGRVFDLENKSTMSSEEAWTKVATMTFATDLESTQIAFTPRANAFWRLKE
jgi:hypothetical protein